MDVLLWILLPGFCAVGAGLFAWFILQSRMDVSLARQREQFVEERSAIEAEKAAMKAAFQSAVRAAEETARRQAFDSFLGEIAVEQRHYTRRLGQNRRALVLQERMFFRGLPLSNWIEHEVPIEEGMDVGRLVQDMTVFDGSVVNIADARGLRALA